MYEMIPSTTGRLGHCSLVVSTKKIVPTIAEGLRRVEGYVVPIEDQNMQSLCRMRTQLSKILVTRQEPRMLWPQGDVHAGHR